MYRLSKSYFHSLISPDTMATIPFFAPALKLILLFVLSLPLFAQNQNAFETFTIGADYTSNINKETLHNYWDSKNGFNAYFSTPFYFGNAQLGLIYLPFEGKTVEYPSYNSNLLYVQWGYELNLPINFFISFNVLAGVYSLNYDEAAEEMISPGEISEREFSSGLSSMLGYKIFGGWNLNFSTSYLNIFTSKEINLINISFGLSKTFDSPQWMRDFLE